MNKPTASYQTKPAYDYHEVIEYLEKTYKFESRDYKGKFKDGKSNKVEYCDFWHWVLDQNDDINNGGHFWLTPSDYLEDDDTADWIKEILAHFVTEFGDEEMYFYVSW